MISLIQAEWGISSKAITPRISRFIPLKNGYSIEKYLPGGKTNWEIMLILMNILISPRDIITLDSRLLITRKAEPHPRLHRLLSVSQETHRYAISDLALQSIRWRLTYQERLAMYNFWINRLQIPQKVWRQCFALMKPVCGAPNGTYGRGRLEKLLSFPSCPILPKNCLLIYLNLTEYLHICSWRGGGYDIFFTRRQLFPIASQEKIAWKWLSEK